MDAKQRQALIGALQARGTMPMGKPMAAPMTALNPDQQRSLDAATLSIGGFSPTGFTGPRPHGYDQPQTQVAQAGIPDFNVMPAQPLQGQMGQGMPQGMPQGMQRQITPPQMPQGMQGGMQGVGQIPPNRPPVGMMMSRGTTPQFESKAIPRTMNPYGR